MIGPISAAGMSDGQRRQAGPGADCGNDTGKQGLRLLQGTLSVSSRLEKKIITPQASR